MNGFKLEPVLRYRSSVEDTLRRVLAEKRERLNAEKEGLETLVARRQGHLRELGEKLKSGLGVSENFLYIDYLGRMDDEMVIRKKAVYAAEEAAEIERGRLIEAVRQRKTLERLKEKHMDACEKKILKKEASLLDEIAVNRFNRAREKGDFNC
jgi:flagellar FliJ protein